MPNDGFDALIIYILAGIAGLSLLAAVLFVAWTYR
jgi:hypothetical protein